MHSFVCAQDYVNGANLQFTLNYQRKIRIVTNIAVGE